MIKIGEYNKLKVDREKEFGFYLVDENGDAILLPKALINNETIIVGDEIEVFVYKDSEDRPIATCKKPLITVGEVKYLEIVGQSKIGAFANIGLERDIFIPIKEQKFKFKTGCKYMLHAYLDKTGRLAASTYVDDYIDVAEEGKYTVNEDVKGVIYGKAGTTIKIAVDREYKGIILGNEFYEKNDFPGEELNLRIKKIYEDGTIGLTNRKKRLDARVELKDVIINYMEQNGGAMPYNDKSSPEEIKMTFNTSKNYFKMALGGLMKEGKITQDKEGTRLK
ncbi:MAG: CvfB family protein [Clostridium sp.]